MALRLLSAAVGIPVLFAAIWYGDVWLVLLVAIAALLGLAEFYRLAPGPSRGLAASAGARPAATLGFLWALALVLAAPAAAGDGPSLLLSDQPHLFLTVLAGGLLATLAWSIFSRREAALKDVAAGWAFTVAGALYVGLLAYALMLRYVGDGPPFTEGRNWLLFAVFTTFATDTGAFFVGRLIGKRPLAPTISPKKSQEGALAGLVAAVGAALALGALLDLPAAAWQQAMVGLVVGVVAQVGDLAESMLKRSAGAKEAGGLIPGHGGVLDRLDSLLFALPVVYYVVVLALGR